MTDQRTLTPRDSKFALPPKAMEVEITPEVAADWLDTRNSGLKNRRLSKAVTAKYTDAMRRSEWKETHQGLAFDTEGWLLDGQHRLQAIANAGVVLKLWVFPNMPRDIFDTLDVGRRRLASHLLSVPNAAVLSSAVRFIAVADGIKEPRSANVAYAELTNTETLELVQKAGYRLEQAARTAMRLRNGARMTPSPTAAVIYQALCSSEDISTELDEFVEGMVTGANLERDDPRLRLRNAFTANAQSRAAALRTPSHPYALTVKAWNAYLMRKPLQALVWRGTEDIPRVLGYNPTLRDKD